MPFSVFKFFAVRAEESGLFWLLEFMSLLLSTWTALAIGALLVVAISKIPNLGAMGGVAALGHLGFVYLCLDAVSWRDDVPADVVAYTALATVTYFALLFATGWSWRRSH